MEKQEAKKLLKQMREANRNAERDLKRLSKAPQTGCLPVATILIGAMIIIYQLVKYQVL